MAKSKNARVKKEGSVASSSDSASNVGSVVNSVSSKKTAPVKIREETEKQVPDSTNVPISFGSRHSPKATEPKAVSKKPKGVSNRMHSRAGLVFPCHLIKRALKNGNYANHIRAGEKICEI